MKGLLRLSCPLLDRRTIGGFLIQPTYKGFATRQILSSSSSFFSTSATDVSKSMAELEKEYENEINDILKGYEYRAERRQALVGKIVSTKCLKTINVLVGHDKYIQKYDKHIRRHRKIMAHDEDNLGELGDIVRIVPCRPRSKKKRHALKDIIRKAPKLDLSGD